MAHEHDPTHELASRDELEESPAARYLRYAIASAFAFGVAFRIFQYAAGRSLWLDEAVLSGALLQGSPVDVLRPGPWGAVPPGFLLLVKLCTALLGSSEIALRFVPLLGGVASMVLFIFVARRYLSRGGAAIAMVIFAVASYPIYYASELKQYSTDAAIALGLLLWAIRLRDEPVTARRATTLALVGLVCVFFSFTAAFVLGGILISLAAAAWRERRRPDLGALGAVGAFWVLLIGVPGLLLLNRIAGTGGYAQGFWRDGFMPLPPGSVREALWLPRVLVRIFREPLGVLEFSDSWINYAQITAGLVAAVAGTVWIWRRNRVTAAFLTLPIVLALAASALRAYPFGGGASTSGRVLLFLVPPVVLLMAEGISQLWTRAASTRIVAVALLLFTAGPSLAENLTRIPYGRTEIKPLLGYLEANRRPGDLLYVHYDIQSAFRFYRPRYDLENIQVQMGVCARLRPNEYLDALSRLRGRPRVWILFAGGVGAYGYVERIPMLGLMEHVGRRLDDRVAVGTSLFLYDLTEKTPPPGEFRANLPNFPPGSVDDCPFFEAQ